MACDHELDAEYLYPSDARVLDIESRDGTVTFRIAVPCTECDEPVAVTASAEGVEEVDLEVPLGGPELPED